MTKSLPKYPRILGIAPSTKGFGFAVLEGLNTLINWGVTSATGNKSEMAEARLRKLIARYEPQVIVFEDMSVKGSRRFACTRQITIQLIGIARENNATVVSFSRRQMVRAFLGEARGTKHSLAEAIAQTFPDELAIRLPAARPAWKSEDSRIGMFDAVALGLMVRKAIRSSGLNQPEESRSRR